MTCLMLRSGGGAQPSTERGKSRDSSAIAGFTLIEMLVALILLAILGWLMMSFLGQLSAVKRLQGEVSAQTELNALAGYLEQSVGGALPLAFINGNAEKLISFEGSSDDFWPLNGEARLSSRVP